MRCVLGKEDGLHLPKTWKREFLASEGLLYGGFLWSDIHNFDEILPGFHDRLLCDFRAGWSAVGLTARGGENLGPYAPPTAARVHQAAPWGLYLLSGPRLRKALTLIEDESTELPIALHGAQQGLGNCFVDPLLEVELSGGERDFCYHPPSLGQRLWSAGRYLFARQVCP